MSSCDVYQLNRSYLIVLRDAVKTNTAEACSKFGIDLDFAQAVAKMSLEAIEAAAQTENLLFRPAIGAKGMSHLAQLGDHMGRRVLSALSGVRHGQST